MRLIYCITNRVNGKKYVGQTKNLKRRRKQHFFEAPRRCDHPMARAVRKYGKDNFDMYVIEECTPEVVDERERFWIAELRTQEHDFGYNCENGGNACKSLSETTRKKIGDSRRKWWASLSQEERDAHNDSRRGPRNLTEEQRQHMSVARKGILKSEEHKAKIAEAHRNRVGKHAPACRCALCRPFRGKLSLEQRTYIKENCDGSSRSFREFATLFSVSPQTIKRAFVHEATNSIS